MVSVLYENERISTVVDSMFPPVWNFLYENERISTVVDRGETSCRHRAL